LRIVADTNVLVSALLTPGGGPGALLAAVDAGEVTLETTEHLIGELAEVLARDRFRNWVTIEQAEAYVERIRRRANVASEPDDVEAVSRDPDDDYLVTLARQQSAILVSGDEDLTILDVEDLEIITPREALDRLR
jgi:uncharacterized protein